MIAKLKYPIAVAPLTNTAENEERRLTLDSNITLVVVCAVPNLEFIVVGVGAGGDGTEIIGEEILSGRPSATSACAVQPLVNWLAYCYSLDPQQLS